MSESLVVPVRTWLAAPIDREVSEAIERLRRAPDVQQIAVMPDAHLASDVCIGSRLAHGAQWVTGTWPSDSGPPPRQVGLIDPTKVVRSALRNAGAVAGLMLTTEAMIAKSREEASGGRERVRLNVQSHCRFAASEKIRRVRKLSWH